MKTTFELPDELAQRVNILSVERDQGLKDTIAQLLELGLANAQEGEVSAPAPKPVRLKRQGLLTINDIEAAIAADRD